MKLLKKTYTSLLITGSLLTLSTAATAENASNPLAAVNNTDLRLQYFDLDGADRYRVAADGAYMLLPNLKLKYELNYWKTDVTGSSESEFETLHLMPIYFPENTVGNLGEWKYKLAVGAELIVDFDNADKGIGSGSDQIAPLAGLALVQGNTTLVPLVQHFINISGPDVSQTAFRVIAIQSLSNLV